MENERRHLIMNDPQRGASLIFVILILVVVALIGAALISLVSNESFTAMNQSAGLLAFGIADGGIEFEQYNLAQNVDWYRSTSDPMTSSTRTLGSAPNAASFTVSTNLPATKLRRRIPNSATTSPICVYTTDRFPTSGYLMIGDVGMDPFEYVQYTGISSSGICAQFTGITRGRPVGGVTSTAGSHERGELVYPVTTLAGGLANNCTSLASLTIADNSKFLTAGSIAIITAFSPNPVDWEQLTYTGSVRSGVNMTLYGVRRCQDGSSSASQAAGAPVAPILYDDPTNPPNYEAEIVSTGTTPVAVVGNANRVIRRTVQR
ncbi:MAG TPA: pilus assembly PilX N-terminal domain-containing protein [Nitrospiria bacterium]|nr:pilus assembly PilX N-terminal domain-containing protein [Nitrospiria bacterium]